MEELQDKDICKEYDDILQERPQIKNVIFLGAGSSVGSPVQKRFI